MGGTFRWIHGEGEEANEARNNVCVVGEKATISHVSIVKYVSVSIFCPAHSPSGTGVNVLGIE